jgi:transcriptional regulator with XRE-family HTH domain
MEHVRENIRRIRESIRLSQKELAERMGEKQEVISRIESGKTPITLDRLEEVAAALNVGIKDLLEIDFNTDEALKYLKDCFNFFDAFWKILIDQDLKKIGYHNIKLTDIDNGFKQKYGYIYNSETGTFNNPDLKFPASDLETLLMMYRDGLNQFLDRNKYESEKEGR